MPLHNASFKVVAQGKNTELWCSPKPKKEYSYNQHDFTKAGKLFASFEFSEWASLAMPYALHNVFDKAFQNIDPNSCSVILNEIHETVGRVFLDSYDHLMIEDLLKNHDNPLVAGFVVLLKFHGLSVRSSATKRIAEKHSKFFENSQLTDVAEVEKFLDPYSMRHGFKDYDFLRFFHTASTSDTASSDSRDIIHRLYSGVVVKNVDHMKLSEISLIPFDELTFDEDVLGKILSLPLTLKAFREFLMNSTIEDINRLFWRLKKSGQIEESLDLSNAIINAGLAPSPFTKNSGVLQTLEAYTAAVTGLHQNLHVDVLGEINTLLLSGYTKFATVSLIKAMFEEKETYLDNADELNGLVSFIEYIMASTRIKGDLINPWIDAPIFSDVILELLLNVQSQETTVSMFRMIKKENVTFNFSQWLEIVGSLDTFLETPVSWWESLL